MYKVYLIRKTKHGSEVDNTTKTITPSPEIAKAAFLELIQRVDLVGQNAGVMLSLDKIKLMFHRFDHSASMVDFVQSTDTIKLFHD